MDDPHRVLGRTLTALEVSLVKRMDELGVPRDEIVSFFSRPGRKLNPAFVGEIRGGKFGADVPPALDHEVSRYVMSRLAESAGAPFGPQADQIAALRLFPALEKAFSRQTTLFEDENDVFEYKRELPRDKAGRLKIAKSMAAFSNKGGGYIFFGVNDDLSEAGLDYDAFSKFDWVRFDSEIRSYFSPAMRWDHNFISLPRGDVGVVAVGAAEKQPVVCQRDYGDILFEGGIFYRYHGASAQIKAHDLMNLLAERDRAVWRRLRNEILIGHAPSPEPEWMQRLRASREER